MIRRTPPCAFRIPLAKILLATVFAWGLVGGSPAALGQADDCANATPISGVGSFSFDLTAATTDGAPLDPLVCDVGPFGDEQIYNDVWFSYTALASETIVVSTVGTAGFDTRLAVYDSTTCPADPAQVIACNDDFVGGTPFEAQVSFQATIGTTYTIRLGVFQGTTPGAGTLTITSTPPLTQGVATLATARDQDFLGEELAVDGALAVAGANGLAGLFRRTSSGWEPHPVTPELIYPDATNGMGIAVDIDASTIVVGELANFSLDTDAAAHVFRFNNMTGGFDLEQSVGGFLSMGSYGSAVAVSGDELVVGEAGDDRRTGRVYAYSRGGGSWPETQQLTAPAAQPGDLFGVSLDMEGTRLVIGAPGRDSVFVMELVGATWLVQQEVVSPFGLGVGFGAAVALSGDRFIASAPLLDGPGVNRGRVAIFFFDGAAWGLEADFEGADTVAEDSFGSSVDLGDSWAVVGAPVSNALGGSVYGYQRTGTVWQEVFQAPASLSGQIGTGVALTESPSLSILAGAPTDDLAEFQAGALYSFDEVLPPDPDVTCNGDGGDQAGCTECPCGNNATPGTIGGCLNSAGTAGRLIGSGSPSVTAPDPTDLRFEADGLVPSSFAVLVSGNAVATQNPASPCFGLNSGVQSVVLDGLRCAVQSTQRHGGRPVAADGTVGSITNGWGGASGPPGGLAAQGGFTAGQTRHYQVFYRELPGTSCMTEQNTSQAVRVVFQP